MPLLAGDAAGSGAGADGDGAVGELRVAATAAAIVLEHPVVTLPASLAAVACELVNFVVTAVAPRLLVPAVTDSWRAAAGGTVSAVHAVRTVHAVITGLPRRDVRDALPALFGTLVAALDARWRVLTPAAVGDDGALAPAAVAAAATHGSAVEVEVAAAMVAVALKLSEAQLAPLLTRLLQWMAAGAGDIASDATLEAATSSGGAAALPPAPAFALAPLARRIAGYRVVAALSAALRSVFTPFFAMLLPHLARDLAALAPTAAGGAGAGVEEEGGGLGAALAGAAAFDGAAYGARPAWHDAASGAAELLVATGPHAARCAALATLRSLLASDTEADPGGFMASAKSGKARLDALLAPLVRQFELPLAAADGAGAAGGAGALPPPPAKRAKAAAAAAATAAAAAGAPAAALGVPGGRAGYRAFVAAYLVPTVGALVTATRRDTLWKPINAALLLATRDRASRVRLAALHAVTELYDRGGDEALVLLPETLPFLSELQHDDDTEVEAATHRLLRELERRSGEDLQHYLA